MKQEMLWLPESEIMFGNLVASYPFNKRPFRLWSLLYRKNINDRPELPYYPNHGNNAFLEDHVHDYNIVNNALYYYSRFGRGGYWLLLEFKDQ